MASNTKELIQESCDVLKERDANYKLVSEKIVKYLQDILQDSNLGVAYISGRVKEENSLKEKIYRKNYFKKYNSGEELINNLSDGIGIRIVCLLVENEKAILDNLAFRLTSEFCYKDVKFSCEKGNNIYINLKNQPESQQNGFDIYRMDALWKESESEFIHVEIQIKSLINLLWGEIEHSLFYKNYDYIMDNKYYSGLMGSIKNELENIDLQISSLQKHMNQNDLKTCDEIREITAFMLSNKYQEQICECVGCKIDLREVYEIYIDVNFLYEMNMDKCFGHMQNIEQHTRSSTLSLNDIYSKLEHGKLMPDSISKKEEQIVQVIDKKIKEEDIFWKSFVALYVLLENHDDKIDYTEQLTNIAKRFLKILQVFQENIDMVEYKINEHLREILMKAITDCFEMDGKLGFFSIRHKLRTIDDDMNSCIQYAQDAIYSLGIESADDIEKIESNYKIIYRYFVLSFKSLLKAKITQSEIEDISNEIETSECSMNFSETILPYVLVQKNISDEVKLKFKELLNMNRGK